MQILLMLIIHYDHAFDFEFIHLSFLTNKEVNKPLQQITNQKNQF